MSSNRPKTNEIFLTISVLASKKRSNHRSSVKSSTSAHYDSLQENTGALRGFMKTVFKDNSADRQSLIYVQRKVPSQKESID